MISKEDALQKFKDIVGNAASWAQLMQSQFVRHLSLFQSWALREALFRVERIYQEFFLSTAVNESSIRAHAEDREYLPRKATSAMGTAIVTNNGTASITIPERTPFQSDDLIFYVTTAPVTIEAGASGTVVISQIEERVNVFTVSGQQPFYEILFDADVTLEISMFEVWVDETGDGNSYVKWTYSRLFENALANSEVYDEFYHYTGNTGVRFGNGIFGKILQVGALVKIKLYLTKGDSFLLNNQPLLQMGELLDSDGHVAKISIVTGSVVTGGAAQESGEELRRNLHYWPIYNEQLVWREDYVFFMKRSQPRIIWARAWGEQEATEANGGIARLDFINKIFVTAYAENMTGLKTEVMDALNAVPRLNRKYEWVDPLVTLFSITVTGTVARNRNVDTVKNNIRAALLNKYGVMSRDRVNEYVTHDCYAVVQVTGMFNQAGERFIVTQSGSPTGALSEIFGIDSAHIFFEVGYV